MNRKEYMTKLGKSLRHLPKSDREVALAYYEEYFEEAGTENEQNTIEELGSPEQVAKQIIQELAVKKMDEREASSPMGLSLLWIIILALFAAPVGLPLSIVFVMSMLCVLVLLLILILAFFVCSVIFVICGIVSLTAGIVLLFTQPANGISVLGVSFILIGFGILWFYGNCAAVKVFWRGIRKLLKQTVRKEGSLNGKEEI